MYREMRMRIMGKVCLLTFMATAAAVAMATPPPPADLRVQFQGPATAVVYSPYVYTATIRNIGNQKADNVRLIVDLPMTNTSPQQFILGTLAGYNTTKCSIVALKLQCELGRINQNQQQVITFNFSLPISSQTLKLKATASTTSNEPNQSNNQVELTPTLGYSTVEITSANVLNSHCTGTGLTSYFECEKFPSSISYHTATLEADRTITLPEPGWTGQWDQPTLQQLHFTYTDNMGSGAEFNGFARSSTCFEGIVTFLPYTGYNSAYRVCIQ